MHKKEILIVEDAKNLRELQNIMLTARGYKVKEVGDGESALNYVFKNKPDLVLLDIMLPKIDGLEVCRQIKSEESTKSIPVIMVTAKKGRADMAEAAEVGADWYISKPFKASMLMETVQRFLSDDPKSDK